MTVIYAIAFYIIIWWTVLFMVLPWGVKPTVEQENANPIHEPGAPVKHNLKRKFLMTTLISALILACGYYIASLGINLRDIFSQ